jgi:hypothetical protein
VAFVLMLLIPERPLRETRNIGSARVDVPATGIEPAAEPADTSLRGSAAAPPS